MVSRGLTPTHFSAGKVKSCSAHGALAHIVKNVRLSNVGRWSGFCKMRVPAVYTVWSCCDDDVLHSLYVHQGRLADTIVVQENQ